MDSYSNLFHRAERYNYFAVYNNILLVKIEKDYAEGVLEVSQNSYNPLGIVHGGALATLADSVAGTAVRTRGRMCVTLNCAINYLAPATGSRIKCVATPQRVGRTIAVYDVNLTDDQGQKVASGSFTFYIKDVPIPKYED